MNIDAPELDGKTVRFIVERHAGGDNWEKVGEATATVSGGSAKASVAVKADQLRSPRCVQKKDKDPTLLVEAPGVPDGREVQFTIEKEESGQWTQAGEAKATVQGGQAEAPVKLSEGKYRFHAELVPEKPDGNLRFHAVLV
jgi:hypothetical protein